MKITLVTHTAYPEFIGGREHHIHRLASELSEQHEVTVIAGGRIKTTQRTKINGYLLITLPMLSIRVSSNPLQFYSIVPTLFSYLRREETDLIHAFEYVTYTSFISYLYSKKYNIPFILTVCGFQIRNQFLKFLKIFYDYFIGRLIFNEADKIICVSDVQYKEILKIIKKKDNREKMVILQHGIHVADYENITIKEELSDRYSLKGNIILLTVTRVLPRKGIRYLIFALDKIIRSYQIKNIKLIIAGPDRGELKNINRIVKELKIENNVIVVGSVSPHQIKDYLGICDIFVLPSLYEGLPQAVLEAMAAGKAIIFTDISIGRKIILNEEDGLLVKPADIDSLTKAIVRLSCDKEFREHLGLNAAKKAKVFDSLIETQKIRKMYEEIVNRNTIIVKER